MKEFMGTPSCSAITNFLYIQKYLKDYYQESFWVLICGGNCWVSHSGYKKTGVAAYNTTNTENYVLVDCSRSEENTLLLKLYRRNSTYIPHMIPLNLNNQHLMICANERQCSAQNAFVLCCWRKLLHFPLQVAETLF